MAKKSSKAKQDRYALYAKLDNVTKNAERKLARHLKKHPNDTQAAKAVGNVGRTRKNPTARLGWVNGQEFLKNTFKVFVGGKSESEHSSPVRRHLTQSLAQIVSLSKRLDRIPLPKKKA